MMSFISNKIKKILGWLLAFIFIFGGFSEFSSSNYIFGLIGIVLGISFLPVFWLFLEKKFNFSLSPIKKAGLIFVLMMIFGYLVPPTEKKVDVVQQDQKVLAPETANIASSASEIKAEVVKSEEGVVSRVVDGDTLEVNVGEKLMKIRVIGINTPETVDPRKSVECFGEQASAEAKKMLLNQKVYLEADSTQGDRDKYNRYLRFVWLENNNVDYGKQMIANGFAFEYTYGTPYKYQVEYKSAQQSAEAGKKGLWADEACVVAEIETPAPSPKAKTVPSNSVNNGSTSGKSCSGPDLDCADFSTHAQAQAFFDGCGFTATNDPMKLDGTGVDDGVACESLS